MGSGDYASDPGENALQSFAKNAPRRQEAEHQMAIPWQVEEGTRVHEGRGRLQQAQGAGLVSVYRRPAQEDRPATFHGQARQVGVHGQRSVEGPKVGAKPSLHLLPDPGGQGQQGWGRRLDWR